MVNAAHGEAEPPPVLKIAWMCEKWNRLPDEGPPLEQDYKLMREMNTALNIYNAITKWYTLEGKQIHNLTNGERSILGWLKNKGYMFT